MARKLNNQVFSLALILNILHLNTGMALTFDLSEPPTLPGFESLVQSTSFISEHSFRIARRMAVVITAYSSTPDQTDDTPFITASNTWVRDGVVAANFLPFNTRIVIPEIFGDKVFVVEDRMHRRFGNRVDIWFPSRALAKRFGIKKAEIIVLL